MYIQEKTIMDPHSASAVLSSFNSLGASLLTILLLLLSAIAKAFDMALLEFSRSSAFRQSSDQETDLPKSLKKICKSDSLELLLRELHLLRLLLVFLYFVWTMGFFCTIFPDACRSEQWAKYSDLYRLQSGCCFHLCPSG